MMSFDATLAGLAALDAGALARPWTWRDGRMSVRYVLYRALEEAQEAHARAAAASHPESRRILALAQRALGDLRGLLAGLDAELLDAPPAPGEWSIREILGHVVIIERRYAGHTCYAVERADADPVRIPEDRLPTAAPADQAGDVATLLGRIAAARAETDRRLDAVAPAAMARPTVWVHAQVDVRFRLHRFASHLVEHTIQCEKTLDVLGWRATEGRRIAQRLAAQLGELERLDAAAARAVEARLVEGLASGDAAPARPA